MQITNLKGPHGIIHIRSHNTLFQVALLRHPPVSLPAGTCYGRTDIALAPGWESWAEAQAVRLEPIAPAQVWSSPASRCAVVAGMLAARLDLPLTLDERLQEIAFGEWEGQAWNDVPRAALDRWALDPPGFSPPGGETGTQLMARVADFGRMLIGQSRSCIVVSHGGPLRLLPALLQGQAADLLARPPEPGQHSIITFGGRTGDCRKIGT